MTYKELLFKMARRGMLTLSNDKDGRGLFWVNMNNMEALENIPPTFTFESCTAPQLVFFDKWQDTQLFKPGSAPVKKANNNII